jgi:dihydrofolate synthase/folylpolyglutamate synthase
VTYQDFLKNLNARGMFRIHPSLDRISRVLKVLGNPQDQWPSVHIAGTNGKGSVAAGLESVLRAGGYRTGLYTSPHLVDLRERIQVNGKPVHKGFTAIAQDVIDAEMRARTPLTHFEFLTAVAFLTFARQKIDIAIIECGLGGLWDATNVLSHPLASIITSIGLDHMEWLGNDERAITKQKSGIIKAHGYVISGVRGIGKESIIRSAREKDATLVQLDQEFTAEGLTASWRTGKQTLRFQFKGEASQIVPFGLLGGHQIDNAALIMAALRHLGQAGWPIPPSRRNRGLNEIHWPGRLQIIHQKNSAPILLDGAHNPHAMKKLLQSIGSSIYRNTRKTFIFSAFKDKEYSTMAQMISPMAANIVLCPLPGARGASLSQLHSAFATAHAPVQKLISPERALAQACQATPQDGLVVVTGSLSLVGEMLGILRQNTFSHPSESEYVHA